MILNIPFRGRKRTLACFGVDVSNYPASGHGKKPSSVVHQALKSCRVRPVRSGDLVLRRYDTYCLLDPASNKCRGPMSVTVEQMKAQLLRMGIWIRAEKAAKKAPGERK